jgi:hypothetical protein
MHTVTPAIRAALEATLQDWLRFEIKKHTRAELCWVLHRLPGDVQRILFEYVILRVPRQTVQLYAPVARRGLVQRIDTIGNFRVAALLQFVLSTLEDKSSSFLLSIS